MDKIKLVIYDLDGVITETSEQHFLAWKQLAEELNINLTREFNETLKGVSRMDSLDRILALGHKNNLYNDEEKLELATKEKSELCFDDFTVYTR